MPQRQTYTAREMADMLGLSLDGFYEQHKRLIEKKGFPASATLGRIRVPRPLFDKWFLKNWTKAPAAAAQNDNAPVSPPSTDAEHRAYLRQVYEQRR